MWERRGSRCYEDCCCPGAAEVGFATGQVQLGLLLTAATGRSATASWHERWVCCAGTSATGALHFNFIYFFLFVNCCVSCVRAVVVPSWSSRADRRSCTVVDWPECGFHLGAHIPCAHGTQQGQPCDESQALTQDTIPSTRQCQGTPLPACRVLLLVRHSLSRYTFSLLSRGALHFRYTDQSVSSAVRVCSSCRYGCVVRWSQGACGWVPSSRVGGLLVAGTSATGAAKLLVGLLLVLKALVVDPTISQGDSEVADSTDGLGSAGLALAWT